MTMLNLTPSQQTSLIVLAVLVGLALGGFAALRLARHALGSMAIRKVSQGKERKDLPGPWGRLRDEVEMSNRTLTMPVFDCARQLFLDYYASAKASPLNLTAEYQREEFLLVVDEHGRPVFLNKVVLDRFRKAAADHPAFGKWFKEAELAGGEWAGTPVLLAARWLCHLVGLRHGTVEIFIDPPGMPGHTLIQVRGLGKFEAPGAFDIPCAGHIDGVDSDEASLEKELGEELNLTLQDLVHIRQLARYNAYAGQHENASSDSSFLNNEHRIVYRAELKPEAAGRIRFTDGEVAGLSVFAVDELREMLRKYPERFASGLSDAMGYYE